jgi:hypothetical protein
MGFNIKKVVRNYGEYPSCNNKTEFEILQNELDINFKIDGVILKKGRRKMSNTIKSGKEILDEFFDGLKEISGIDPKIADALIGLYQNNKFNEKQIFNALIELREEAINGKN